MVMPNRLYVSATTYRYGFNGKEKDDELKSNGNSYDFGARLLDPRLGRWLSCDPQSGNYPGLSPYSAFANSPLIIIDPQGETLKVVITDSRKIEQIRTMLQKTTKEKVTISADGTVYVHRTLRSIFSSEKPYGTDLIRSLVKNSKHTLSIDDALNNPNADYRNITLTHVFDVDGAADPTEGSDVTIFFNFSSSLIVPAKDGGADIAVSKDLELDHELTHGFLSMIGQRLKGKSKYFSPDVKGGEMTRTEYTTLVLTNRIHLEQRERERLEKGADDGSLNKSPMKHIDSDKMELRALDVEGLDVQPILKEQK
jgi:RHS repeat-associated protein